MGLFSFLGNVVQTAIGVGEAVTGIDVPLFGPGDRFFGGVPGGKGPLDVQGLPSIVAGSGPCFFPMQRDDFGNCVLPHLGGVRGRDPSAGVTRTGGRMLHGPDAHADHQPQVVALNVRRCGRGSVLGIDGICHPKRSIRNSDRWYPKAPRPLGTRTELKAVRVAGTFANRLKRNEKSLRKTARVLAGATRGR